MRRRYLPLFLTLFFVGGNTVAQSSSGISEGAFCAAIENAATVIHQLEDSWQKAFDDGNDLREKMVEQEQETFYETTQTKIFTLVKDRNFQVQDWLVTIRNIDGPKSDCHVNVPSCITVQTWSDCSEKTTLYLFVPTKPDNLQLLSATKTGDKLTVVGALVANRGGPKTAASPVLPESSGQFNGAEGWMAHRISLSNPRYSIDVVSIR
jgi:hypothetical protein